MNETVWDGASALQGVLEGLEVDTFGVALVAELPQSWLRDQVVSLLPGARSVAVLGMEIWREVLDHSTPEETRGAASPRELMGTHQDFLCGRLNAAAYKLARECRARGFKSLSMPSTKYPVDDRYLRSILSYKHVAEAAGVGTLGRHSLLVTPRYGPRVRLCCVLTEATLRATPPLQDRLCDECNLCIASCPPGALSEPPEGEAYAINKFACKAFRTASGDCNECMRVCSMGR